MTSAENADELKGYEDTKWFAKFFDLSEERIRQLADEGIVKKKKIKGNYYYPQIQFIQNYIKYLQDIVSKRKKTSEEQESEKLDAEIRLKQAKADMAQIDLKILKSEVLVAEDVQSFVEDLAATIRSHVLGVPGRLAIDLEGIDNTAERADKIERVLTGVLDELKGYEFNIDYYKKRVAERKGKNLEDDDESDND